MNNHLLYFFLVAIVAALEFVPRDISQIKELNGLPQYNFTVSTTQQEVWSQIIPDYKDELQNYLKVYMQDFNFPFPQWYWTIFRSTIPLLKTTFNSKFMQQIKYIAQYAQMRISDILFINLLYDFNAVQACTSIVLQNTQGEIFLSRNLDYDFQEYYTRMSIQVNTFDDTKQRLLYSQVYIVGFAFSHTVIQYGSFAISINLRQQGHYTQTLRQQILFQTPSVYLLNLLVRGSEQYDYNYESALNRLINEQVTAPIYYIIVGTKINEGCVIEKQRNAIQSKYILSEQEFFLVQTNYDRNQPDPVNDYRRIPAQKQINQFGPNITQNQLYELVLSKSPNLNVLTILTIEMSPAANFLNITQWY